MNPSSKPHLENSASLVSLTARGAEANLGTSFHGSDPAAMLCPNCSSRLEGRKCKLFCQRPGCGYQVTCAEW